MIGRWNEPESYMAHGWLITPLCLWLLWLERGKLRSAPGQGSLAGFAVVAFALLIHLGAGLADASSLSGLTLPPLLLGFALLLHGRAVAQAAAFPALFLLFMVPPPEFVISGINFTLKLAAADLASFLLNLTGLPAIRHGSFMLFGSEKLAIGDVCSGLRSLLALLALSVLYAWLIREKGRAHVAAALLVAVPAAILGNGVRIFLVAYLVTWLGSPAVFKPRVGSWDLHLLTGAAIFAAAFACLFATTLVLDALKVRSDRPAATGREPRPDVKGNP